MTDFYEHIQDEYIEELYELPTNGSDYCLVQGQLIEEIHPKYGEGADHRISQKDAMNIARYLNRGRIEKADEELSELLEPE